MKKGDGRLKFFPALSVKLYEKLCAINCSAFYIVTKRLRVMNRHYNGCCQLWPVWPSVTIHCQVTTDSCPMKPAGTNLTSGNYLWIGAKQVVPRCGQAVSRCDQLFVRCQYMLPEVSFIIGDGTKCDQVWPDVTRSDQLWPGTDFAL